MARPCASSALRPSGCTKWNASTTGEFPDANSAASISLLQASRQLVREAGELWGASKRKAGLAAAV